MTRIRVNVIPRAKTPKIQRLPDGGLRVRVAEPAKDGRANEAVIEALAEHFHVSKRAVTIIRGTSGRHKLIEVVRP